MTTPPSIATGAGPRTSDARTARREVLAGLALAALVVAVFAGALFNGFIWDDDRNITANPNMDGAAGLWNIWTAPRTSQQYYPLTHTTFWLQAQLFGLSPRPFHALNVLLQAGVAVLLWRVLRRLSVPGAWVAAAVFAIHPVQVESVAWITERKNLLSGVFYLAAALLFLRFAGVGGPRPPADRARRIHALALALFGCGLLAKTAIFTLPFALAIVLWWQRGTLARDDLRALAPFLAAGIAMAGVTAFLEWGQVGASGPDWDLSLPARAVLAGRVLWFYLGKLVAPFGLVFIYPRFVIDPAAPLQWVPLVAAVAAGAALWALRARIGRGPLAAALFFAVTLGPTLGFFRFYFQVYSYVQDHFQYLACAGPLVGGVALATRALRRAGPRAPVALAVLSAVVLAALGGLSAARIPALRDERTLWERTLAANPGAWMAALNLAQLQIGDGQAERALDTVRLARQGDHRYHHEAHHVEGLALAALGRGPEAIAAQRRALELKPDYTRARVALARRLFDAGDAVQAAAEWRRALERPGAFRGEIQDGLARALEAQGRTAEAAQVRQAAAQVGAGPLATRAERGAAFARQGRWAEAVSEFAAARERAPKDVDVLHALANALVESGRLDDADGVFAEALALAPRDATLVEARGLLRARQGRHDEALALYEDAARLAPDAARLRYNMGLSHEALKRPDAAIAAYREAIRLDPRLAPPHNNLAIALYFRGDLAGARAELARYRALGGTPHPDFVRALDAAR